MSVALPVLMADLGRAAERGAVADGRLPAHDVGDHPGHRLPHPPVSARRTLFGAAMGLFTAGTLLAALAPGFAVLLCRPGRAGGRDGDHDAAADDHGDDARAAGPPRRDDGQHLDRDRGGTGDRSRVVGPGARACSGGGSSSGWCCRSRSAPWCSGLQRITDVGEPTVMRIDVGSVALSVLGFGGHRVRPEQLRPGGLRRHVPCADLGAVSRSAAVGLVAFVARQLVLQRDGPRPAGPAHLPFPHVHHGHRADDADDGDAARHDRPAAAVHAGRARAGPAGHRPAPAAGRSAHGPARAGGGAALRPVGRAPAAGARHGRDQRGGVVRDAVRHGQRARSRARVPPAAQRRVGVRVHPAVHRRARRAAAAALLLRQRGLRSHPAARRGSRGGPAGQRAQRAARRSSRPPGRHRSSRWRQAHTRRSSWPRSCLCWRSAARC